MTVSVHFNPIHIRMLAADLEKVPNSATRDIGKAVEKAAKKGNLVAKEFARVSAGEHGKWYHLAFSAESKALLGLTWAYGPVSAMPQGGMSFEFGSRNQPPHLDLAKSADLVGPGFLRDVDDAIAKAMW